jgi:acyl carrier protein phosphodiesterase
MNYLAHLYLSGKDEGLIVGNFIADALKGRQDEDYPEHIRRGIDMHRAIDRFTDDHPLNAEARRRLHPFVHKYAGVVMDMYHDHFLASEWGSWSDIPLTRFTRNAYVVLSRKYFLLPPRSKRILPFMMKDDWLSSYALPEGLDQAFRGMARRTPFASGMEKAVEILKDQYPDFREVFRRFFPELIEFTEPWQQPAQGL